MEAFLGMFDANAREQFDQACREHALGGQEIMLALVRLHEDGESLRAIAKSIDMPRSTLQTKIIRAHTFLRSMGVMPEKWEKTKIRVGRKYTKGENSR